MVVDGNSKIYKLDYTLKSMKKKGYTFILPYVPTKIDLSESFKAQTDLDMVTFPRELGEKHPFDFIQCDILCSKFGLAQTAVDKHLDFIISPGFYVTSKDKKAQELISKLIQDTALTLHLREWIKEALKKGNGFMEISIKSDTIDLKVINANNMYVKRDRSGTLLGYNQYIGKNDLFNPKKIIPFNIDEIAHLKINQIADSAYGYGILKPSLETTEDLIRDNKDMHILLSRKANNPIIVKVGSVDEPASQADVTAIGQQLVYLNNLHEWAFDHKVDFSMLDFGNITDKFTGPLEHDKQKLYMEYQVPAVLMGDSQQNEGIANVQIDTFERRVQSLQEQIERVIEEQIFRPFLKLNGLNSHVEIEWGQPSEESTNERILKLTTLLSNQSLNPNLRRMIEIDIAQLLDYDEKYINLLPKPEAGLEKQAEMELEQPEIPGEKPSASQKLINQSWNFEWNFGEKPSASQKLINQSWNFEENITIEEFVNLKEFSGFNYKDYIKAVLNQVKKDEFIDLKALNESQINDGLLDESQIKELRLILYKGFKNNKRLIDIEKDIKQRIEFKDRLVEGKIVLEAERRPNIIARTETVRLANEGIVKLYKSNDIKEVSWLSSISDRTCEQCLNLDGQIFNINELKVGINQPPLHPNCRCALLSVKE